MARSRIRKGGSLRGGKAIKMRGRIAHKSHDSKRAMRKSGRY